MSAGSRGGAGESPSLRGYPLPRRAVFEEWNLELGAGRRR
jgi:hypothetical protein